MAKQVIDAGTDQRPKAKHSKRDAKVWENFKLAIFPEEAEKGWRFYTSGGLLQSHDRNAKRDDGKRLDVFDPKYCPCPAFVKDDTSKPFEIDPDTGYPSGNVHRCNFELPEKYTGKKAMAYAQAHMQMEHWEDWKEVFKRSHGRTNPNGEALDEVDKRDEAPPMDTTFAWTNWRDEDSPSAVDMTPYEHSKKQAMEQYVKSKRGLDSMEKINTKRGRPPKVKEEGEVDGVTSNVS